MTCARCERRPDEGEGLCPTHAAEDRMEQLRYEDAMRAQEAEMERDACTCAPCMKPANAVPGVSHCAACCRGSLIEEYDPACPVDEHRYWALRQMGQIITVIVCATCGHDEPMRVTSHGDYCHDNVGGAGEDAEPCGCREFVPSAREVAVSL